MYNKYRNILTYMHTCTLDLLTSSFNNCIQQNSSIPELPATKTDPNIDNLEKSRSESKLLQVKLWVFQPW